MNVTAVRAASLYLSPPSGEYSVGQSFTVTVGVSSPDQAINAVSGVVTFPVDKLEVTAVSKSGSVLGLWVQEPSFSNTNGSAYFEGIALNPGFIGNTGKAVSISFKTKSAGTASIALSSGSVLANDGLGTNITAGLGRATITIKGKETAEGSVDPTPTPPALNEPTKFVAPGAITITSSSHPDSNAWYNRNTVDLNWSLPAGVTAVSVFVDRKSDTVPTPVSDGRFDSYSTTRLDDGVWYFHLRTKNTVGWGAASHFRFQIDTASPETFLIKFVESNQTVNPQPTVVFNTSDALSGVKYYEIKVGDDNSIIVSAVDVKSNPYTLPPQQPGTHRMLVEAFDAAGNHTSSSADFTVTALNKPVIVQYPARLKVGDILTVKGATDYPDTPVRVWIKAEDGSAVDAMVRTDAKGQFVYMAEGKMRDGIYKLWAQVRDERGGVSELSDKVTVVVERTFLLSVGSQDINIWFIIIPILVLGAALWLMVWRTRKRLTGYKDKFNKNATGVKEFMHHAFNDLRESFLVKLRLIEQARPNKRLTALEKKLFNEHRKELIEFEKIVERHINSIKMPKK